MSYKNYGPENHSIGEGLEINDEIIQPGFQSFFLMACRGNFDLIRGDKLEAQKINNWFTEKIRSLYSTKDPRLATLLKKRVDKTKRNFKNFESEGLLGKVLEFALEDLFKVLFEGSGVQIFKTSEYDDVFCGIDYIIIGNGTKLGIDLKVSSKRDLDESKGRKYIVPVEFNLYNRKGHEIRKSGDDIFPFITDEKRFGFERKLLQFEPHLAQLFLYEYMQLIKSGFDGKNNKNLARKAWENAIQRYEAIGPVKKGAFLGTRPTTLVNQIINTRTNLFSALI